MNRYIHDSMIGQKETDRSVKHTLG